MEGPIAEAFSRSSNYLVAVAKRIPDDRWHALGLGEWSVLELLAHANRSHSLVSEYLVNPVAPERSGSGYFDPSAIASRARSAVAALGADPVSAVEHAGRAVTALVARSAPEATIGSPMGTMTLIDYLPSRVAELTIHGDDLARAVEIDLEPPAEALRETLDYLGSLVARRSQALDAMRVLTGRGGPSPSFSVY